MVNFVKSMIAVCSASALPGAMAINLGSGGGNSLRQEEDNVTQKSSRQECSDPQPAQTDNPDQMESSTMASFLESETKKEESNNKKYEKVGKTDNILNCQVKYLVYSFLSRKGQLELNLWDKNHHMLIMPNLGQFSHVTNFNDKMHIPDLLDRVLHWYPNVEDIKTHYENKNSAHDKNVKLDSFMASKMFLEVYTQGQYYKKAGSKPWVLEMYDDLHNQTGGEQMEQTAESFSTYQELTDEIQRYPFNALIWVSVCRYGDAVSSAHRHKIIPRYLCIEKQMDFKAKDQSIYRIHLASSLFSLESWHIDDGFEETMDFFATFDENSLQKYDETTLKALFYNANA